MKMHKTTGRVSIRLVGIIVLAVVAYLLLTVVGIPPITPIRVTQPRASSQPYQWYVNFDSTNAVPRHIAAVKGAFTLKYRVSSALFSVRNGQVQRHGAISAGRTPSAIGRRYWEPMELTFALGDQKNNGATMTSFCCAGSELSFGSGGIFTNDMRVAKTMLLPGYVKRKRDYLVYVEGDRPFDAERRMSPQEFADQNPKGSFLVVSLRVN